MKSIRIFFIAGALLLVQNALAFQPNLNHSIWKKDKEINFAERANIFTHKHVLKIGVGYSTLQGYTNSLFERYQEELPYKVNYHTVSPCYSFRHEIYMDELFSFAYSAGYSPNRVEMNNRAIQTFHANVFIHPKLNIFRRRAIEGYMQLNVGVVYNDMKIDAFQHEILQRRLPANFKLRTGFTPIGLNFRITDQVWFNFEASLWSYESLSFGIKFKLNENIEHPKNWVSM